jgi:acetylornithine deacetylase/succinyl-diaminopimelate desuccinylase-like protein
LRGDRQDRRRTDARQNLDQRIVARLSDLIDPLPLAQGLIRCNSVTPADGGAQDVLAEALSRLGFTVHRLRYGEIENVCSPASAPKVRISVSRDTPTSCRPVP